MDGSVASEPAAALRVRRHALAAVIHPDRRTCRRAVLFAVGAARAKIWDSVDLLCEYLSAEIGDQLGRGVDVGRAAVDETTGQPFLVVRTTEYVGHYQLGPDVLINDA